VNTENKIEASVHFPFGDGYRILIETSPDNLDWTRIVCVEEGGEQDELISFPSSEVGTFITALRTYKAQMDTMNETGN